MRKQKPNSARIGVFGASGSGKSTLALALVKSSNRVIFFDPLDDLPAKNRFTDLNRLEKFLVKNYQTGFRVAFVPDLGQAAKQLDELSKFLIKMQNGFKFSDWAQLVTLFVDELNLSFPLNLSKTQSNNKFYFLCCRGRHYGINIVGISQRMSQVDLPFRANLSDLFILRLADFNDIKNATNMLGAQWREPVQNLKNHEYIYKGSTGYVVKCPPIKK